MPLACCCENNMKQTSLFACSSPEKTKPSHSFDRTAKQPETHARTTGSCNYQLAHMQTQHCWLQR